MTKMFESPVLLLIMTGGLLGLYLPLGKVASLAQVSPTLWAMIVSLGAVVIVGPVLLMQKKLCWPRLHMLRYVVISALISYVIPNLLLFAIMAYVGAGYMGLMYALTPVYTLGLAVLFKMKTPQKLGVLGICFGLVGAMTVTVTRSSGVDAPSLMWIVAALFVPISLACGNVYRTLDWPEGASPDILAFWSHIASVGFFLLILYGYEGGIDLTALEAVPQAATLQLIVGGLTFPVLFRLQQKGGPVLLSQIGYIAAAIGLALATLFLGESYSQATWAGAGIIAFGIFLSIISQVRGARAIKA
ncbi:MAG: DMT family transporter [Methylocystaceae bacterium]|nr:DMT family transporter [Methylocystaceae bacterium]